MAHKVALITGANSGIGYEMAKALVAAPENYHVLLAGRSLPKVEAAITTLIDEGADKTRLRPLQLDVTSEASIIAAAKTVQEKFSHLDLLVNNAGIQSTAENVAEEYASTFTTNVIGPVLVTNAFRPLLLKAKEAYSVYVGSKVSSLASLTDANNAQYHSTNCGTLSYRSSKAALNMVAMHDQLEMENTQVKVRIMCPGLVVSNIRGTNEGARKAGGMAEDPSTSAQLLLSIIRGERDDDAATLMEREGAVAPW